MITPPTFAAATNTHSYRDSQQATEDRTTTGIEIVFVADNLPDWETLAGGVPNGLQVVVLDSRGNGLQQMADWLATQPEGSVDAVHVLSHGRGGQLSLGTVTVTADNLGEHAVALDQIGRALTPEGDLLLYGCDSAAGQSGMALVNGVAALVRADVAASNNITGSASQQGDWILEIQSGHVEAQALEFANYAHTLLTVDTSFVTGLDFPGELLLDNQNNLYVNSAGNYKLFKFPAASGNVTGGVAGLPFLTHSSSWGVSGSAIDASGNLYVGTGSSTDSVVKYAASGGLPSNSSPTTIGSGLNLVADILLTSDGKLLVTDNGANKVYIFSASGSFTPGSALASASVSYAEQMYLDGSNNLYVASADSGKIIKFSAVGGTISLSSPSDFITGLNSPRSITGDGAGNFYVGDGDEFGSDGNLYKFSSTGGVANASTLQHTFTGMGISELLWGGNNTLYAALASGAVAKIALTNANAAPTIGGITASTSINDTATATPFSSVTVGDADADNVTVTITLDAAAKGVFTAASLTASGFSTADGGATYTHASATPAAMTTAIQLLVFDPTNNRVAPGSTETTSFTIAVNDGTTTTTSTNTTSVVSTSVNDAPTVGGASAGQAVNDNATTSPFSAFTIADVDSPAQTLSVSVSLDTAAKGSFTNLNGFVDAGSGVYTFSGTAAAAQTAIRGLVFTPTANRVAVGSTETTTFTVSVNDGFAVAVTNNTTTVVSTSVNDAPTITGAVASQAVNDNATKSPFTGVTIGDVDSPAQTLTVSVTLDAAAKGSFTTLNGFTDAGGGVYTFSGTAAAATTAIRGLVFTPTANRVAPGSTETTTFTISTNDGVASAVTNNTTTVVSTSVNDAPVISNLSTDSLTVAASASAAVIDQGTAASIADVDNANFNGGTLTVSFVTRTDGAGDVLSIRSGSGVTLSSGTTVGSTVTVGATLIGTIATSGTGTGTDNLIVNLNSSATPALVSTLLQNITYDNTAGSPTAGDRTVRFVVTDGSGGSSGNIDTTVSVTTNAAPTVTTPTAINLSDTAAADTFTNQTGTLSASDSDGTIASYGIGTPTSTSANFTDNSVTYDISKTGTYGTLYVVSTGADKGKYVYVPNATAINALASGTPTDTFTVTATDNGGASGNATLTVNVTGVNDTPSDISLSASTVNQSGGTNATVGNLTTTDADTGQTHTYSLVAGNGTNDSGNANFNISGGTLRANDASALAAGTYNILVRTTDNGTGTLTYDKAFTVTVVDNVAPTVTSIVRQTPATSPTNADSLIWRVTFSEAVTGIDTADFSVSGTTATVASVTQVGSTNAYDVVVSGGDLASLNATATLAFAGGQNITDTATTPNALAATTPTGTNNNTYVVDNTAPTLNVVSIASNNANTAQAKVGDVVTVSFTTDGTQSGSPTATILGHAASVTNTSGNNYTATYTLVSGDTAGPVTFAIAASDAAGNAMTAVTAVTDSSSVNFDKTAPALNTVSISSNNANTAQAKVGDVVTVSFTSDGTHSGTPTATILGHAASVTNTSGNNFTATYTLVSGDTEGPVAFAINASDAAGNAMTAVTAVTDSSSVNFDKTAPTLAISTVATDDKINNAEDESSVSISGTSSGADGQTVSVSVAGGAAKTATIAAGGAWSVSLTSAEVKALAEGNVSITADVSDAAGNPATQATKTVVYDKTAPTTTFTGITFSTDTGASSTDLITNTAAQTIGATLSGPLSASEKVFGSLDGGTTWTDITAMVTGTTLAWTGVTLTGSSTLKFKVSDAAGNEGPASSQAYTLDTAAPVFAPATSTPADNATTFGIASDIIVKFDERLDGGSDLTKVFLKDVATDTLVPATVTLNADGNIVINPTGTLAYSTAYYVTWDANALKDTAGNAVAALADEVTYNFTSEAEPPPPSPDPTPVPLPEPILVPGPSTGDDGDGIPTAVESQAPKLNVPGAVAGDGNGDGVSDSTQNSVTSAAFHHTPTVSTQPNAPEVYITLVAGGTEGKANGSTATITSLVQKDAPANLPEGMNAPLGLISFKAQTGAASTSANFSLYVDPALGVNGYWKQDASGTWVNLASATFGGNMVSEGGKLRLDFVIQDGGQFDADGAVNGIISDPGALGSMALNITEHHPHIPTLGGFWF